MAIGHRATGTAAVGIDDFTPGIPGGTTTGDMMILLVGGKPYNATFGASHAPGWTQIGSPFTDGTTAAGNDTGSMQVTAWYKEHDGSEADPLVDEGGTAFNSMTGLVMTFSKGAGETWETPVIAGGGDATAGTGFSVTCGSDPGVTTGDHCISFAAFRSDSATPCSSHLTPTQTGVTFSNTHDPATDPETNAGGDMGMCITRSTVSGTGSAAPVLAATLGGSHTGSAAFIRLRVSAGAATVNPSAIARSVTIPAVTVKGAAKTTPDVTARSAVVPAPTVKGAANTTPSVIARTATVDAPTVKGGAVTTPAVTARSAVIPQVTAYDSGSPGSVTPDTIVRAAVIDAPTVKGAAEAEPATIALAATIPQVTLKGGAVVSPALISLSVVIPQATPAEGAASGSVSPSTIARSVTVNAPTVKGGAVLAPDVIARAVTIAQATPKGAAKTLPQVTAATVTVPAATLKGGAVATPSAISRTVALDSVTVKGAAVIQPGVLVLAVEIPQATAGEVGGSGTIQEGGNIILIVQAGADIVSRVEGAATAGANQGRTTASGVSGGLRVGSQG